MRMIESVRGRDFSVGLTQDELVKIQAGTLKTRYKGLRFCKNPFDVVIYLGLLERIRPRTIIEIGTSEGGSAVWFRDQCLALGLDTDIHTFDIDPPAGLKQPGIHVHRGDANDPAGSMPATIFENLPHPWVLIEDSAHTFASVLSILRHFDPMIRSGDFVVVEDGVVADLPGPNYAAYEDGPNRAVEKFLSETGDKYRIDEACCDFYGHNVTYCPNGWLAVA